MSSQKTLTENDNIVFICHCQVVIVIECFESIESKESRFIIFASDCAIVLLIVLVWIRGFKGLKLTAKHSTVSCFV